MEKLLSNRRTGLWRQRLRRSPSFPYLSLFVWVLIQTPPTSYKSIYKKFPLSPNTDQELRNIQYTHTAQFSLAIRVSKLLEKESQKSKGSHKETVLVSGWYRRPSQGFFLLQPEPKASKFISWSTPNSMKCIGLPIVLTRQIGYVGQRLRYMRVGNMNARNYHCVSE